jgi:hypothetical protein
MDDRKKSAVECDDAVQASIEAVASDAGLPESIARIAGEVVRDRILELGRVLGRMVELLGSGPPRLFGQALEQACAELGVRVRSGSEEESALLRAAFAIIANGKIPGAPDA